MSDEQVQPVAAPVDDSGDPAADQEPESDQEPEAETRVIMPPVESRFMFVDIAALRAKQLRRGALARVPLGDEEDGEPLVHPKLERVAMQEIEQGLIVYKLPDEADDTESEEAEETATESPPGDEGA